MSEKDNHITLVFITNIKVNKKKVFFFILSVNHICTKLE